MKALLAILAILFFVSPAVAADGPRPFDKARDAAADVEAALARADENGRYALIVLGGNWCHDSRGLAAKFEEPALAAILAQGYETVFVDVGRRDRNLAIPRRFGVETLIGTPTVLILSSEGVLLNAASVHDWRTADSRSLEEAVAYFARHAPPGRVIPLPDVPQTP